MSNNLTIQETVIFAKFFDFKNDDNQQVVGGEIRTLGKVVSTSNDFGVQQGHKVAKHKLAKEEVQKIINKVPCLANVTYDVSIDNDMRTTLVPVSVEFVKEFKA